MTIEGRETALSFLWASDRQHLDHCYTECWALSRHFMADFNNLITAAGSTSQWRQHFHTQVESPSLHTTKHN